MSIVTAPTRPVVSANRIKRYNCKEDYFEFVKTFWSELIGEEPVWNWHIRVICKELQKVCERVFERKEKEYDLIINVPPGSTKSTLCSVMLLPWMWTRMPECRFLGGSFDGKLSMDFGNKARRIIKSKLYQDLFPEIQITQDQDTKSYIANTLLGERYCTSSGASIIGRHFHIQTVDDPIDPNGARSEVDLKRVHEWMDEGLAQRCVSQAVTPLILVMQRLSVDDPTGVRLAKTDGTPVRHICLPAELSDNVKPAIFKNKYKNGLLDPIRIGDKVLEDKKAKGAYFYAGQYEQLPVPQAGGQFQVEKLRGPCSPPDPKAFKYVVRHWDKACSVESGAYTAGVLMGMLKDSKASPRYWILNVIRKQIGTYEREELIKRTAHRDREIYGDIYRVGLEQEPGSGGKDSAQATIWNLAGFIVHAEKPTGKKTERAEPFATQVNSNNVAYAPGDWVRAYTDELKHFGDLAKYKDQVDASSGAFNWLTSRRYKAGAAGFLWFLPLFLYMGI